MANLSVTTAWNETTAFVGRESRLLFPLAFMLASLPMAVVGAIMPQSGPNQAPEGGLWLILLPIALLVGLIGNLAISYLALRPATSVGEAIGRGLQRFLPLVGAVLLLMIAGAVLLLIVAIVTVMLVPGAATQGASGTPGPAMLAAIGLTMIILVPFLLFFGARLMPMTPVAAAENGNPFAILARSWALTSGHTLKLIGLLLLVGITVSILSFAVESIAGLAVMATVGSIQPGSTGAFLVQLVLAAMNMVVTAFVTVLIARIYAQLAGTDQAGVFV
ncbi:hypothetical protein RCO27_04455 [Sphingosinicella sp. LHD-64]|uniref:hypothetical protein n=1 Tax=Sphingosinicella sp. LHD-64 TaxID=3072139 RepID=UPI00280ED356|nr:hypothetical protein [Sphingosinicella sp. LHD-64]MDQ8755473.1 hypothetical protein [Sphingosinicella sp. LHD-64]